MDAYKRFIGPAIEREIRGELTEKGEEQAIHIFSENLRKLLLQPPLKGKIILGVDPAFRTGCKFSVLDQTGKVLEIGVVYPHTAKARRPEAKQKLRRFYPHTKWKLSQLVTEQPHVKQSNLLWK